MEVLKRSFLVLFAACAIALFSAAPVSADGLQLREREIKAGLLYNFLKYTTWPEQKMGKSGAIVICLYGGDPFDGYLDKTKGRTVQKRPISIQHIQKIEDASDCNMLFLSALNLSNWPEIAASLKGHNVLTVSDADGFTSHGGMIEFSRKDQRVHVLLNKRSMQAAQLEVNNRLLKLVTVVASSDKGGDAP